MAFWCLAQSFKVPELHKETDKKTICRIFYQKYYGAQNNDCARFWLWHFSKAEKLGLPLKGILMSCNIIQSATASQRDWQKDYLENFLSIILWSPEQWLRKFLTLAFFDGWKIRLAFKCQSDYMHNHSKCQSLAN